VEPALVERYGHFPDRIDVDELLAAIGKQGAPLENCPTATRTTSTTCRR
jgi:hypothetical protein